MMVNFQSDCRKILLLSVLIMLELFVGLSSSQSIINDVKHVYDDVLILNDMNSNDFNELILSETKMSSTNLDATNDVVVDTIKYNFMNSKNLKDSVTINSEIKMGETMNTLACFGYTLLKCLLLSQIFIKSNNNNQNINSKSQTSNMIANLFFILLLMAPASSGTETTTPDLSFLKKICGLSNTTSVVCPLPPPELCTSFAIYTTNPGTCSKDPVKVPEGEINLVVILNDYTFDEFRPMIAPDQVDAFIETTMTGIEQCTKVKAIVFEHLIPCLETKDEAFKTDLTNLLVKFREKLPETLFGLAIEVVNVKFSPDIVAIINDCGVDFFVAKTYNYHQCLCETDETAPVTLMTESVSLLCNAGFKMEKLVIIVQVGINVICSTNQPANPIDDISFSNFCSVTPTNKYCKPCVNSFYLKGKLISEQCAGGVLIQFIDNDDFDDHCKCCEGGYPILRAIDAGVCNCPEPKEIISCPKLLTTDASQT